MSTGREQLRAIDTAYNGYLFRSRLEARWAVFFDALGIPYRYELEGFTHNGISYLPDFWLPDGVHVVPERAARQDVWVEVKPTADLPDAARAKMAQFLQTSGYTLLLLTGDPGPEAALRLLSYDRPRDQWDAPPVSWFEMKEQKIGLLRLDYLERTSDPAIKSSATRAMTSPRLIAAYTAARQARFDGVNPTASVVRCESCGRPFLPRKSYHRLCRECYHQERAVQAWPEETARVAPPAANFAPQTAPEPESGSWSELKQAILIMFWILFVFLVLKILVNMSDPAIRQGSRDAPAVPCSCEVGIYDKCRSFETQAEAQQCFDYCRPIAGDVHKLDLNGDGRVCLGK